MTAGTLFALAEQQVKQLEKTPIWHSVSCLCIMCIAADERWLNHQPIMLTYTNRPFFADE